MSVNIVDLVKNFLTGIYYLLANIGFDTAENGPLKVWRFLPEGEGETPHKNPDSLRYPGVAKK